MNSQRITVTIPEETGRWLRRKARDRKRPLSRIVADALDEQYRRELWDEMAEGYREASALNRELAEEALPAIREVLPPD